MLQHPVLAIDTCAAAGTVALLNLENSATTVTCIEQMALGGRAAAAELVPTADAMLRKAALEIGALRSILVVSGPGSFTGVRVGLSTAKGLAHAARIPIVSISRLAVLASLAPEKLKPEKHKSEKPDFLALLDAGRNEFYARRGEREWLASFAEIAALAEKRVPVLIAEDAIAERLAAWNPVRVGSLDAYAAGRAALERLRSGDAEDLATLDANYLRRSDAELFARLVQ